MAEQMRDTSGSGRCGEQSMDILEPVPVTRLQNDLLHDTDGSMFFTQVQVNARLKSVSIMQASALSYRYRCWGQEQVIRTGFQQRCHVRRCILPRCWLEYQSLPAFFHPRSRRVTLISRRYMCSLSMLASSAVQNAAASIQSHRYDPLPYIKEPATGIPPSDV